MAIHPAVVVQPQPEMVCLSPKMMPRQWSSGLCDCCEDMDVCCCGFWCPWCLMCRTASEFGECVCLPLVDVLFGGVGRPITVAMRSAIRERYNIQGTVCGDCFVTSCCPVCVWCQMARELKKYRSPLLLTAPVPMSPAAHPLYPNQPMPAAGPNPMAP